MKKEVLEWILTGFIILSVLTAIAWSNRTVDDTRDQPDWWKGENGQCGPELTRADLDESLALGRSFLLNSQKEAGNFEYQFDWLKKEYDPADNQVRQAGATWGVALLYEDHPDAALRDSVLKSLDFWKTQSHVTTDGLRYVTYFDERWGQLGTVALVTLSHIEVLRAEDPDLPAERRAELHEHLDGYLEFLLAAGNPDGRFRDKFLPVNGKSFGPSSPYSDGEALLALIKAAKYLDRPDLLPHIHKAARAGIALNVNKALAEDPDSNTTKGYYQWASMSWMEMVTADWENGELYGDTVIELADWMIDVHKTLTRTRNTAYAYEGLLSAYVVAERRGDEKHLNKYACVINSGLRKMTGWQLGHSLAIGSVQRAPGDPRSRGGIQNHATEPPLRIDVTQHQMHAVTMARDFYRTE